jgi:hypothetical protein
MPNIQVKLRRGTTTQHAGFTGAEGEVTVDTDKDTVIVHDGTTAGGHELRRKDDTIAGSEIDSGAVDTAQIAADAVTTAKIAADAVTNTEIATDAVDTDQIAADAVTSTEISSTDTTFKVAANEVAVNDGQGAIDFRVESDTANNLLLCDASENKVGIGTVPSGYKLDVKGSTSSGVNSSVANLHASAAGAEAVLLLKNDSATGEGVRLALFNSNTSSYPNANKVAFVLESATPALCVCFNTDQGNTQATFKFLSDSNAFFVANTSSVPGTPSGGGVLYVESGALKYKGSSGTITTLGAA